MCRAWHLQPSSGQRKALRTRTSGIVSLRPALALRVANWGALCLLSGWLSGTECWASRTASRRPLPLPGMAHTEIEITADGFRFLAVDRSSRNCRTQMVASWAGESPGRPSRGYQPAKSSSHHSPVQPVSHPHRVRTARVARPCDLRGQRRDLLTGTGTERQRTPRQLHRSSKQPPSMPADHAGPPGSQRESSSEGQRQRQPSPDAHFWAGVMVRARGCCSRR